MDRKQAIEQAQFIFNSLKNIRGHFLKIPAQCHHSSNNNAKLSGLSPPQIYAILAVYDSGDVTVTELAQLLNVSAPSASVMVDRLVAKGTLVREQNLQDRRKVAIRIAPDVLMDIQTFQKTILQSLVDVIEKIGPETAAQWCVLLKSILLALEE